MKPGFHRFEFSDYLDDDAVAADYLAAAARDPDRSVYAAALADVAKAQARKRVDLPPQSDETGR